MHKNMKKLLALVGLIPCALAAQVMLFEDFATLRETNYTATVDSTVKLWWADPVPGNQTLALCTIDSNQRLCTTATGTTESYLYGPYIQFLPLFSNSPRYPFPDGFLQDWIKTGTWDPLANRLSFWMRCDKSYPEDLREVFSVGTYVKHHSAGFDEQAQGNHYYHFFPIRLPASKWVKAEMNTCPTVLLGSSNRPPCDPEWVSPTTGAPVHYFDGLTRFYIAISDSTSQLPVQCAVDQFEIFKETGDPDIDVRAIGVTHDGTAYWLAWNTSLPTTSFEVRRSTASMKTNGFGSGTDSRTLNAPGSGFSPGFSTSFTLAVTTAPMYFAIRPTSGTAFSEVFYTPTPGGTTVANDPPVVAITAPTSGSSVACATTVNFTGTATDAQDGTITANLKWLENGVQIGTGGSPSKTYSCAEAGAHTVSAQVTDAGGLTSTATVNFTVTNTTPSVGIQDPDEGEVIACSGATVVTFTGTATDVEDGTISASLEWSEAGAVFGQPGGASVTKTYTCPAEAGSHAVTALVRDTGGLVGSTVVTFVLDAASAPTVSITFPAGGATVRGNTRINATASDSLPITMVEFFVDGVLLSRDVTEPYSVRWNTRKFTAGSHSLTAKATNQAGASTTSAAISVTVAP